MKIEVRCKVCDKMYNSKFNLKRHMKNVHAMEHEVDTKPWYSRPHLPDGVTPDLKGLIFIPLTSPVADYKS